MDEEIEKLVVAVRADTAGFARDVETMRGQIDGPLASSLESAGASLERGLLGALRRGRLGFEDLRRVALAAMSDIAAAAVGNGIGAAGGQGGLVGFGLSALSAFLGLPGRATGGPVAPGRGFLVGERGPELFVPTASGRVEPLASTAEGPRDIRLTVNIGGDAARSAPEALRRSSRQLAREVRRALADID